MRSQQSQIPNILSSPSRKNFPRAPPRAARKEFVLPARGVSPHHQSNQCLRNEIPLSLDDCDPPKTRAIQLHAARQTRREETSLSLQEAVQENRSTTRRQLRLYCPARAECAPRPQTSALAKHSFGGNLLFQNFQSEALVQLHSRCTEQRTHGLGRASLPPDHFAQILGMHTQFNHRCLRPVDGLDFHVVRVIHECPGDLLHQFLHSGTSFSRAEFVTTNRAPRPRSGTKRISFLDAEPPDAVGGSKKCLRY